MPVMVYECPLAACPWKGTDPPPEPGEAITSEAGIWRFIRDRAMAAEGIVKAHLETHTLLEWVQEVARLREQAAGTVVVRREDLACVFNYARHFDVDDDGAMLRVAAAGGWAPGQWAPDNSPY